MLPLDPELSYLLTSQNMHRGEFMHSENMTPYCNKKSMIFVIRLMFNFWKLLFQIVVRHIDKDDSERPLKLWLSIHLFLDMLYMILLVINVPHLIGNSRVLTEFSQNSFHKFALKVQASLYIFWVLVGFALYWRCENCYEENFVQTFTVLLLEILGFFNLILPMLAIFGICVLLPTTLLLMEIAEDKSWIENKDRKSFNLETVSFIKNGNTGDHSCSICAIDYEENDKIIILPCNIRHFFHEKCINKWLSITPKCPVCRARVLS
ncbi:unnamed protein product [Blepharisma stoltei]|uniref:RING-type domain-containing protein n=1 Tax=Blepharisma stoltei TaxID=1481888 RepID=A0AAU9IGT4_9CILI|nr:unnamed protein product [Blepharisma stoltei]